MGSSLQYRSLNVPQKLLRSITTLCMREQKAVYIRFAIYSSSPRGHKLRPHGVCAFTGPHRPLMTFRILYSDSFSKEARDLPSATSRRMRGLSPFLYKRSGISDTIKRTERGIVNIRKHYPRHPLVYVFRKRGGMPQRGVSCPLLLPGSSQGQTKKRVRRQICVQLF